MTAASSVTKELPCTYRSAEPIGVFHCGCGGQPPAYRCTHPELNGYCSLHAVQVSRKRIEFSGGETLDLPKRRVPACACCKKRVEPPNG